MTRIDHSDAILRIETAYIEMPGLKLTAPQARRLWNIPGDVCDGALATLVKRGFLVKSPTGTFLRRAVAAPGALPQAS
jgi:hypothetical protein